MHFPQTNVVVAVLAGGADVFFVAADADAINLYLRGLISRDRMGQVCQAHGWQTVLLVLVLTSAALAQNTCERNDGVFGTAISVVVDETDTNPNVLNSNPYRAQLPLFGNINQVNIQLTQGQADLIPSQYFTLESVNGNGLYVRLINALDRDGGLNGVPPQRNSITYGLTCTSNGQTRTYQLTINLRDLSYQQLSVFQFTATDKDANDNGRITYSITSGDINNKFAIDATTARFNITVADGNDNGPAFQSTNCYQDNRGFCVRSRYTATIVSGSQDGLRVDDNFGNLLYYTARINQIRSISRSGLASTEGAITVYVAATEDAVPYYRNYAELEVFVTTANQFAPTLSTSSGQASGFISESATVGELVRTSNFGSSFNLLRLIISDQDFYSTETIDYNRYAFSTNFNNLFSVTSEGYLQLATLGLDFETSPSLLVEVVVRETGFGTQLSSTLTLTINVANANDNSPVFPTDAYEVSFQEGTYQSRELLTVRATDADTGSFGTLTYSISAVSNNGGSLFFIDSAQGRLRASGTFTGPTVYTVTVQATDGGSVAQTVVLVTVTDTGIASPSFPANIINIVVSEGVLTGNSVYQSDATDPDNDALTYSMSQINTNHSLSATMTLSVSISDINDNNPVFSQNSYTFSVDENANSPTVGTVSANDIDQAGTVNSQVFYSLPNSNRFTINSQTGQITVIGSLDYETQNQYVLIAEASDSAIDRRTGTATVTVNVRDIQDQVPLFVETSVSANVPESANIGTVAIDADSVPNVQYELSGTNSGDFRVQNINGVANIIVNANLNFETRRTYNLFLTTTDGQNSNIPGASASVFITVTDVNEFAPQLLLPSGTVQVTEGRTIGSVVAQVSGTDNDNAAGQLLTIEASDNDVNARTATGTLTINVVRNSGPPSFSQNGNYFTTVDETLAVASSVLTVSATDFDSNTEPVQYSVLLSDFGAYFFSVDPNSGLMTVRIVATDTGGLSSTATAQISVNRNLNTPQWFQTSYQATINENYALYSEILRLSASDSDTQAPHNTLSYIISSVNNNAATYFQITSAGFQVSLRDQGQPQSRSATDTATVTITVSRNQFSPLFFNSTYYTTILESQSVGSSVMTRNFLAPVWTGTNNAQYFVTIPEVNALGVPFQVVSATDGDSQPPHNTVYYSLTAATYNSNQGPVDALAYFQMNSPTSGEIIRAIDGGTPQREATTSATVTVSILRNNNPPIFIASSYSTQISKTQATQQTIFTLFGIVKYRLVGANTALNYYQVNENTGEISLTQSVESDTTTVYTLIIQAYDNGIPALYDTETVTVTVTRNTQPPTFSQQDYDTTILETQVLGDTIITVRATDPDQLLGQVNNVEYFMTGSQQAQQYFFLNPSTGEISARQSLRNDMTVYARDFGTPQLQSQNFATVTITVIRNENCPVFSGAPYAADLSQSLSSGTSVFRVTATDADTTQFGQVSYAIVGDNEAVNLFNIDQSGIIRTSGTLFGRSESTYTIVYFTLSRNENTPVWLQPTSSSSYRATTSVLENTNFNAAIYNFQARDNDVLTVTLGDQVGRMNVNTATLTINVIRNQNTPYFVSLPYNKFITESQAVSSSIFTVTARDDDQVNTFERVTYQITGDGNAPAFFGINSNTGVISLTQSLSGNADTVYNVRVTAYDNGTPQRSNSTIVYITVDRNGNAPFFQPTSYSAQVADNGILGSLIVQLTVNDLDTVSPYNDVRCFLRQSTSSQYFFVDEESCGVYLARNIALDTNAPSTYSISVGAVDLGNPSRSAAVDANVFISVQRNQFSPEFFNDPYTRSIAQSEAVGSFVLQVTATDRDTVSPFGDVSYRLIGDDDGTVYFSFNPTSRNITVARDLSLDTATLYRLRIEARDGGNPARSATSLVSINVRRNLFDPVFATQFYNVTIDETQSLGVNILQITASDQDTRAPNNVITYVMTNNNFNTLSSQYFTVNSGTGAITLRQSLLNDNSDTRRFTFNVAINDNGIPQRQGQNFASVEINVIRNTSPPLFVSTPYDREIDYTTAQGTLIFTATATDADVSPYNIISYDLIGDDGATVFFRIDANNGEVRLTQSISQETTTQYRLTIRARDNGNPRLFDTETVYLTSPNNVVRYFFEENVSRFRIDETTGIIYIRTNLYTDEQASFTYNVRAVDQGSPSRSSTPVPVTITVLRNEFPPVFINEIYTADITDGFFQGSNIIRVTANDLDSVTPFNQVTYSIIGDDNAPTLFTINPSSGQISYATNTNVNLDSTSIYRVRVLASDGGIPSLSDTTVVYLNITRNRFSPAFLQTQYNTLIPESQSLGAEVLRVSANDQDTAAPYNVVEYSLIGNTRAQEYFQVSPSLGVISLIKPVYQDSSNDNYVFPPVFQQTPYTTTINENINNAASVYRFTVTDADSQSPFNLIGVTTIGDDTGPTYFYLESVSSTQGSSVYNVRVQNVADLGLDTATQYQLRLYAQDGGNVAGFGFASKSANQVLYITVRRNTFPPIFTNNNNIQTSIGETAFPGAFIVDLNATDADDNIQVRATDGGFPTLTDTTFVDVSITRVTETLTFFTTNYQETIAENRGLASSVLQVQAQPGPGITYSLVGYSDGPDYFNISSTSGQIFVRTDLRTDRNKKTVHLRVQAYRVFTTGPQTAFANVTINVQRNLNTPTFNPQLYEVNVPESLPLGSSVVQLTASDNDIFDVLRYEFRSLQFGGTTFDDFYLGPTSGLISLKSFLVIGRDQSSPERTGTATVRVNVVRSQSPPVFINNAPYTTSINYDTAPGTTIYRQSRARDQDLAGTLRYGLTGQYFSAAFYFMIDEIEGDIMVRNPLTSDTSLTYTLGLLAYDTAYPGQVAYTNITILVNRNPNAPVFNPQTYQRSITEDYTLGFSLVQIETSDADGDNVRCDVTSISTPNVFPQPSNLADYFYLNPYTCLLTLRESLRTIGVNTVAMTVRATDDGIPNRQSSINAQITININRNENDPFFIGTPYVTTIPETTQLTTSILRVTANDADNINNQQLTYALIGDDSTSSSLIEETRDYYIGRIVAYDSGSPARSATVTARININRNINTPVFNPINYNVTIMETEATNYLVLTVSATDSDRISPWNTVTYQIQNFQQNSLFNTYFDLNTANGQIRVRLPLYNDFTNTRTYSFVVTAQDGGNRVSSQNAQVTINVIRNLFPPVFTNVPYSSNLPFSVSTGSRVFDVNATDSDTAPYNTVTYSIIGDEPSPSRFSINPSNGLISTTSQGLFSDSNSFYVVRVLAQDGGTPRLSSTTTVFLTVERNLNTPIWQTQNYTVTVNEIQDLGTTIISLQALDTDVQLEVSVRDSDPANPRTAVRNAFVTVNIIRNNFAPVFTAASCDVQLTTFNNQQFFLTQVTATDQDGSSTPFGRVRYSIIGDDVAVNLFNIDEIRVQARDLGAPARYGYKVCSVSVQQNFQAPFFLNNSYQATVQETFPLGNTILTVYGRDNDLAAPHNTVRYRLTRDPEDLECFLINEVTGNLALRRSLLYDPCTANVFFFDTRSAYQVRLQVNDGGIPSRYDSAILTVSVTRNLQSPVFDPQNYEITIFEDQNLGENIICTTATDSDVRSPHNEVRYEAVGSGSGNAMTYFAISATDGCVYVRRSLRTNNFLQSEFTMFVRAYDLGTPQRSSAQQATVRITVLRNNNCPVFNNLPTQIDISQTQSTLTRIFNVSATDSDAPGRFSTITYSLIGDDNAQVLFNIDGNGFIYVSANNLISDAASIDAVLTVNVRRNEFAPFFVPNFLYTVTIMETHNTGQSVVTVQAQDNDIQSPNNLVNYYIASYSANRDMFYMDPTTGNVFLRTSIIGTNVNQYNVSLIARDNGIPSLSANGTLIVNILRNQFPPVFVNEPYRRTIDRNLAEGSLIDSVTATDRDTQYDIIGDDMATTFFLINSVSGRITLRSSISADNNDVYSIRVRVQDGGNPRRSDITVVLVSVNRNLFPPVFNPSQYSATILDTQAVGFPILYITATDADTTSPHNVVRYDLRGDTDTIDLFMVDDVSGALMLRRSVYSTVNTQQSTFSDPFNSVRYEMIGDDGTSSFFFVNETTGLISLRANTNLEFDTTALFIARIRAYDGGFPSRSATATVRISVLRNLFSPIYNHTANIQAPENTITFYQSGNNFQNSDYFLVNPTTGVITLLQSVLNTNTDFYRIQASAQGQITLQTARAFVNVTVIRNANCPVFQNDEYPVLVQDTQGVGASLITLLAPDQDGDVIRYSIVNGQDILQYFYLNPFTGVLSLSSSLFNSGTNTYRFTVQASDQRINQCTDTATVSITVRRDESAPQFTNEPYSGSVREIDVNGTSVTRTSCFDVDRRGSIVYAAVGYDVASAFFTINSQSGDVSLYDVASLRLHSSSSYTFRIQCYDSAYPDNKDFSNVVIQVRRNINPPVCVPSYFESIPETYGLGVEILRISATDADGDRVTYAITGDSFGQTNRANEFYFIGAETGIIYLKKPLTDSSHTEDNQQIRYLSDGVYPAPTFFDVNPVSGTITLRNSISSDALLSTTYFMKLLAYDTAYPSVYGTATATIFVNRNPSAPAFNFQSCRANIPESASIGLGVFNATASDNDGSNPIRTAVTTCVFSITRDTAPPVFIRQPYRANILENRAVGDNIYTVTATDADLRGSIVYGMSNDFLDSYQSAYYFSLDVTNGIIRVRNNLRTEITSTSTYEFLKCKDKKTFHSEFVQNLLQSISMIYLSCFQFVVTAYDSLSPRLVATATVTITVSRNPSTPIFALPSYTESINEYYPIGNQLFNITATDPDGDVVRYSFVAQNDQFNPNINRGLDFFYILEGSGLVYLKQPLYNDALETSRFEEEIEYVVLRVQAYDTKYRDQIAESIVSISVTRNENGPEFLQSPYRVTINETISLGSCIITVSAEDNDGVCTINQPNNQLINYKSFIINTFINNMTIVGNDNSNPSKTAFVEAFITVVRDQFPPFFTNTPYSVVLSEYEAIGAQVFNVNATDNDLVGQIRYALIGDYPTQSFFRLDTVTGRISTTTSLRLDSNYGSFYVARVTAIDNLRPNQVATSTVAISVVRNPNTPVFTLNRFTNTISETTPFTFRACDNGLPQRCANSTGTITVTRNAFPPVFTNEPYSRVIAETTAIGTTVLTLSAIDRDQIGDLVFEAISTSYPFEVNRLSGAVTLQYDNLYYGPAAYSDRVRYTISNNFNNFASDYFYITPDQGEIYLRRSLGNISSTNQQFSACFSSIDVNDMLNYPFPGQIRYRTLGFFPATDYFSVDSVTGAVRIFRSVRNEQYSSLLYVLTVEAYDTAFPLVMAQEDILIDVVRNPNSPVFLETFYRRTLSENVPLGNFVLCVNASDADGDTLSYEMFDNQNQFDTQFASQFFFLTSRGCLYVQRYLYESTLDTYTFTIRARDHAYPEKFGSATVQIEITRDRFDPRFDIQDYSITITETSPVNSSTPIISVRATDNDLQMTLRAYDSFYPYTYGFANVRINVIRNPNAPVFSLPSYEVRINENFPLGNRAVDVQASDQDGDRITYRMIPTSLNASDYFLVNFDNGDVYMIVQASDNRGINTRYTNVSVTINVDRNQPPFFVNTPYRFTVSEQTDLSTSLYRVTATDGDLIGDIVYNVLGDSYTPGYFTVDSTTGIVSAISDIRLDNKISYTLRVGAYDSAIPYEVATATVLISVTRNPSGPVFREEPYRVTLAEATPVGSSVYRVTANDADNINVRASDQRIPERVDDSTVIVTIIRDLNPPVFTNEPYQVSILDSQSINQSIYTVRAVDQDLQGTLMFESIGIYPAQTFFSVNNNGNVIVSRSLKEDSVGRERYTLRLITYDSADSRLQDTSDVTILVTRNPSTPQFSEFSYSRSVSEAFPLGNAVLTITATDQDGDDVTYSMLADTTGSLTGSSSMEFFYLMPGTGQFAVRATDNGNPRRSTDGSVTIQITRAVLPRFLNTPYSTSVQENSDFLTYSLSGDFNNDCTDTFYIRETTGEVYLARSVLNTGDVSFTCTVTVSDNGYPSNNIDTALITIRISRDVALPVFTNNARYVVTINEDRPVASSIISVSASRQGLLLRVVAYDTDVPRLRSTAEVFITVVRNLYDPIFVPQIYRVTIDETTPVNQYIVKLNVSDSDGLTVRATDNRLENTKFGTATVYVTVLRDLSPPRFTNLPFSIDINEQTTIDTIVYALVGQFPVQSFFDLDTATGQVTLRNSLLSDNTQNTIYTARFIAYDSMNPTQRAQSDLTIRVTRNQFGPVFNPSSYIETIADTYEVGATVLTVTATDQDGDSVYFTHGGDATDQEFFYVSPNTGAILLRKSLSNSVRSRFTFTVTAVDNRPLSVQKTSQASVTINVLRDSGPPQFVNTPYRTTIPINQGINTTFYTVSAIDNDLKGTIVYRLDGFVPGTNYFGLNTATGDIYVTNSLALSQINTYQAFTLLITAYDSGAPLARVQETVTITVNRNLNTPIFESQNYEETVYDFEPIGSSVVVVRATDADTTSPENLIMYDIASTSVNTVNEMFSIHPINGLITINRALTTESFNNYRLIVSAEDLSYPFRSSSATVNIVVIRNNNGPVFTSLGRYDITINEGAPVLQEVLTVTANDADEGLNGLVRYNMINSPASSVFGIELVTGQIFPRVSLLEVSEDIYQFQVQATDTGIVPRSSTAQVTIRITREGNPFFSQQEFEVTIPEDKIVGTQVFDLDAVDPRSGSVLVYDIYGDGDAVTQFKIDSVTGRIDLAVSQLNNNVNSYVVRVRAYRRDFLTQEARTLVRVYITRNSASPTFQHGDLTFTLNEDQSLGMSFGEVEATDANTGRNGEIRYSIRSTDADPAQTLEYFYVNPISGTISVIKPLSEDTTYPNNYRFYIVAADQGVPSLSAAVRVTVIVVRNRNGPVFRAESYEQTISEFQPINTLVLAVAADDADNMTIRARDNPGSNAVSRFDTATVTITVTRNPNRPVFTSATYNVTISEYLSVQQSVIRTVATDADPANTPSGTIDYSIEYISSTPTNGFAQFVLRVVATDQASQPKSATATVYITIIRNQHAPIFTNQEGYTASISDYWAIGRDLFQATAIDDDRDVVLSRNTPNAEFDYLIDPDELYAAQFFGINKDGILYVKANIQEADKREEFKFYIVAIDRSWNPRSNRALVTISVTYSGIRQELGFSQPAYYLEIIELNVDGNSNPTVLTTLDATDADSAENGRVTYSLSNLDINNNEIVPFLVDANDGSITASREFIRTGQKQYRFTGIARDNPTDVNIRQQTETDVIIDVIENQNRFILVVSTDINNVNREIESIRQALQNEINRIVLIESVNYRRYLSAGILSIDYQKTDVTFVVVNHLNRQFTLYTNGDDQLNLYNAYLNNYRIYHRSYEHQPDFTNPPSFLKEYETQQTLDMYMPPDETVQDLGEINMSFNRADSARHTGEVRKISTRNPVYDNSQYQVVENYGMTPRSSVANSNVYHVSLRPESRNEGEATVVYTTSNDGN
ncbi:FAT4-like protein [Mya arenaria]|uniref:FAT4-like protein n=1 Tax=Mya arenaria TaxID=6604 RepID=A0ABY7DFF0_MYAAR|nr:FAT4-like protein [Mya arenaria]